MLQFDTPPRATADDFPELDDRNGCTLGPSHQALGVIFASFPDPAIPGSGLIDLQLFYRGTGAPQQVQAGPVFRAVPPISQTFPGAVAFVARSHTAGVPAQVIAQVWETTDGPLPASGIPQTASLSGSGQISCLCAGGGGPPLDTTDGIVDVNPTTQLFIGACLTLTNPAPGVAQIDDTDAGAGIEFDTDNEGGWLDVTTNNVDGDGLGMHLLDKSGGGILLDLDALESQLALTPNDVTLQANRDVILLTNAGKILLEAHDDAQIQVSGLNTIEAKLQAPSTRLLGFFNTPPVVQQPAPSTAQDIADALANYGLLAGPGTIGSSGIQFGVSNTGTYLEVTTTSDDGTAAITLHDTGAGAAPGILIYSDFGFASLAGGTGLTLQGGSTTPGFMLLDDTGVNAILPVGTFFKVKDHTGTTELLNVDESGYVAVTANFDVFGPSFASLQGGTLTPATVQASDVGVRFYIGAGTIFTLYDSTLNPMLQMTEGSPDLHIKTGGTVIADL